MVLDRWHSVLCCKLLLVFAFIIILVPVVSWFCVLSVLHVLLISPFSHVSLFLVSMFVYFLCLRCTFPMSHISCLYVKFASLVCLLCLLFYFEIQCPISMYSVLRPPCLIMYNLVQLCLPPVVHFPRWLVYIYSACFPPSLVSPSACHPLRSFCLFPHVSRFLFQCLCFPSPGCVFVLAFLVNISVPPVALLFLSIVFSTTI